MSDTKHNLVDLTQEEIEDLKEQLLKSIYADIGANVVKKVLWVAGTLITIGFAWLSSKHV